MGGGSEDLVFPVFLLSCRWPLLFQGGRWCGKGLRNEPTTKISARKPGFKLTIWTDSVIFQVLTGEGGLSQLTEPPEIQQPEAASCCSCCHGRWGTCPTAGREEGGGLQGELDVPWPPGPSSRVGERFTTITSDFQGRKSIK